jgi:hypothetical protein
LKTPHNSILVVDLMPNGVSTTGVCFRFVKDYTLRRQ